MQKKKILDSLTLHLHLCWSEWRLSWQSSVLCPCCASRGEGTPASRVPMCVPCWDTGCWLGNAMEQPGLLGTFSLHCAVPSQHFTNHHKGDDKKGEKKPSENELCVPSLAIPCLAGSQEPGGAGLCWLLLCTVLWQFGGVCTMEW